MYTLSGLGSSGDTFHTAVTVESEGEGGNANKQDGMTNGDRKIDDGKYEGNFRDQLWHIGLDEDLEETLFSYLEGVIGSTEWVS